MYTLNNILTKKVSSKSIWFMRQAGRYLPEFRKIRSKNKNFIKLCLDSNLSSEITLQPIRRFDLDSAIIFSDILMVPYALGQKVEFTKNYGPKLSRFNSKVFFSAEEKQFSKKLSPVYKAIDITRKKLDKNKSLISFIGAPWTLLIYMLNAKQNTNEINFHHLIKEEPLLNRILENLIKFLCIHIKNQINAGSDVVQIFDSWAGFIPEKELNHFCFAPNLEIVNFCKNNNISSICFPKGIRENYKKFNTLVKPDGLNLDSDIDPLWAKKNLDNVVLQGGLDPNILLRSDEEIFDGATKYIQAFKDIPYVFNLGHGLLPETDPDKLERLIKFYRNY